MIDAGLKIIMFRAVSFAVVALLLQNGSALVSENDTLHISRKQTSKTTNMRQPEAPIIGGDFAENPHKRGVCRREARSCMSSPAT
jgi:hypothetical protein